jgi:helix-turn-helix protein
MRRIDELFTAWPFLASRRLRAMLHAEGLPINRKRVQRLMRRMGIAALVPKPNTSKPAPGHKIFPYLLRGLAIERVNQLWAADISGAAFLYLVAIIDWASRAVLSCGRLLLHSCLARSAGEVRRAEDLQHRSGPSQECLSRPASPFPWTDAGAGWTTSSSSGCGAHSSMRTSTSRATPTVERLVLASRRGWSFTIMAAFTRRSTVKRRRRSGATRASNTQVPAGALRPLIQIKREMVDGRPSRDFFLRSLW